MSAFCIWSYFAELNKHKYLLDLQQENVLLDFMPSYEGIWNGENNGIFQFAKKTHHRWAFILGIYQLLREKLKSVKMQMRNGIKILSPQRHQHCALLSQKKKLQIWNIWKPRFILKLRGVALPCSYAKISTFPKTKKSLQNCQTWVNSSSLQLDILQFTCYDPRNTRVGT